MRYSIRNRRAFVATSGALLVAACIANRTPDARLNVDLFAPAMPNTWRNGQKIGDEPVASGY